MEGDYYDFFRLSPDRIALVAADVSDKGMAAALLMAITHTRIRSVARQGLPPAETLRRVNAVLAAERSASMFATSAYGEYHTDSGRLIIANAGHNPPLLRSANGEIQLLRHKPRLPLGALPNSRYEAMETELGPEDCILFIPTASPRPRARTEKNGEPSYRICRSPLSTATWRASATLY